MIFMVFKFSMLIALNAIEFFNYLFLESIHKCLVIENNSVLFYHFLSYSLGEINFYNLINYYHLK